MTILRAKEHGRIPLEVTDETRIRHDILKHAYVTMRADDRPWAVADTSFRQVRRALFAGSLAGLLPLTEDTSVLIQPRFPANLTHMVNAVGRPTVALDILRDYGELQGQDAADWMLDHLSESLVSALDVLVQQGLLRTYVERHETTSSPKGRVDVGATIARQMSRGVDYQAEVSFYERTEENPPNQALLEGLHWVREWIETRPAMRALHARVYDLLHLMRYVPRDREGLFKRDRRVRQPLAFPEARSAYRHALPLATALLERRGFSLDADPGDFSLSSLLVKTDEVFEEFVRLRLSEYLTNPALTVVDGNVMPKRSLYDEAFDEDVPEFAIRLPLGTSNIQPDILIEQGTTTCLVIDVKYKPVVTHAAREDVIEQLVTYAHRLRCPRAVSIHPTQEGQTPGLFVSGRIGTTTLYNYRVSLGAEDLEAQMRAMTAAMEALC